MTQKHKESDLEQVKSLLRRLEDIPEPQAAPGLPGPHPSKTLEQPQLTRDARSNVVGIPAATPRRLEPLPPAPNYEVAPRDQVRSQPQDTRPAKPTGARLGLVGLLVATVLIVAGAAAAHLARPTFFPDMLAASGLRKGPVHNARPETKPRSAQSTTATVADRGNEPEARLDATGSKMESGKGELGKVETAAPAGGAPSAMVATTSATTAQATAVQAAFETPSPASPLTTVSPTATVTASLPEQARTSANVGLQPTTPAPAETGRQSAPPPPVAPPSVAVAPMTSALVAPPSRRSALPDADNQDEDLQRKLVLQGQQMLTQGHVASARLLFRRAADTGSAEAAILLGDTFDPQRLYALGVRGVAGDLQQSIRWYEKADELGAADAKDRLMGIAGR